MQIIFLDLETTGLSYNYHSVLSFACIIRNIDGTEQTIQKFYYADPHKKISPIAIRVNKLSHKRIAELRKDCFYPEYFKDDNEIEKIFENNIKLLVGHNIAFDINFIKEAFKKNHKIIKNIGKDKYFCTMKENRNKTGKTLKLSETCKLYDINIDTKNFHNALYDTIAVKEIFDKMQRPK